MHAYPPPGSHSRRDVVWHQSAHFLWWHLQHLQLVLASERCPVVASRNWLSSWLPLLPYLEANSTGANGLFKLARGCWILLLGALDWHDLYCQHKGLGSWAAHPPHVASGEAHPPRCCPAQMLSSEGWRMQPSCLLQCHVECRLSDFSEERDLAFSWQYISSSTDMSHLVVT